MEGPQQFSHLREGRRDESRLFLARICSVDDPDVEPEARQFVLRQRSVPDEPVFCGNFLHRHRRNLRVLVEDVGREPVGRPGYLLAEPGFARNGGVSNDDARAFVGFLQIREGRARDFGYAREIRQRGNQRKLRPDRVSSWVP
jgi:hypothetical protein